MKKVLLAILSLVLIAACLFGLFAGVASMKDILNIYDYKMADADSGRAAINDQLLPGIQQLKENYDTYMDGVDAFEAGKIQLADGKAQLAAGAAQLADGERQVAEGEAQLADGYRQYNEGKALLEANTDLYNKGKELEGTLDQVYGLISQWNSAKNAVVNGTTDLLNANPFDVLHLGSQTYEAFVSMNEQMFLNTARSLLSTDLITNVLGMSVDIPQDAETFPTWFMGFVEETKASLREYEAGVIALAEAEDQLAAGEAALADGKAQLQQGYADYAAGQAQLADGEKQLAEGEAQLAQFEEGQVTLLVGLSRLLSQPSYEVGVGQVYPASEVPDPIFTNLVNNIEESDREAVAAAIYPGFYDTNDSSLWNFPVAEGTGKEVCPSMLTILRGDDHLGASFNPANDVFMQENGGVMVRNGYPVVNLYVAQEIAEAGLEYIDTYQAKAVTHEVIGRAIPTVLLLLGSVLGLIAGLLGIISLFAKGVGGAKVLSCISFLCALAGIVVALIFGAFKGAAFGVTDGSENPWGHIITRMPDNKFLIALIILAVAALLTWLVAAAVKKELKKSKKNVQSGAYAAAAPVAQPVYAAPAAEPVVAQPVYAAPVEPVVAQPVYATPAAAVSAAEAAAEAARKAAAEAAAAAAAGDVAAAERAAAAAEAAAKAAAEAAKAE